MTLAPKLYVYIFFKLTLKIEINKLFKDKQNSLALKIGLSSKCAYFTKIIFILYIIIFIELAQIICCTECTPYDERALSQFHGMSLIANIKKNITYNTIKYEKYFL